MSAVSVVRVQAGNTGIGTGFVVYCERNVCLIMTARHLVEGHQVVRVIFPGGRDRFAASVLQFPVVAPADLALLRFSCHGQRFVPMVLADQSVFSRLQYNVSTVYLRGYTSTPLGELSNPACFPGKITGEFTIAYINVHCLRGSYASDAGTSGGPVTMNARVIGVNVAADAGQAMAISVLSVYNTLAIWTGLQGETIDVMLQQLALHH